MKNSILAAALMAIVATPVALPTAAIAQNRDYGWHGDDNRGNWNPRDNYQPRRGQDRARVVTTGSIAVATVVPIADAMTGPRVW